MTKIKLVTDSCSDISCEKAKELGITVVPLQLNISGKNYLDQVELTTKEFMEKLRVADELPKSSQPAPGDFAKAFNEIYAKNPDCEILCILLSGHLSGTVQSAELAKTMVDVKVTVFDSHNASYAIQIQLDIAAKLIAKGATVAEIVTRLSEVVPKVRTLFAVDTLENLVKGGRLSKGKAMIGTILSIKPILEITGGKLESIAKVRSIKQAGNYYIKEISDTLGELKYCSVIYTGSDEEALKLKNKLQEKFPKISNIPLIHASPILATHTAEGALGVSYLKE